VRDEEYRERRRTSDAILFGGGLAIGAIGLVGCFVLAFCGSCAGPYVSDDILEPPDAFRGQVDVVFRDGDVCLLSIVAYPETTKVRRMHLGEVKVFVGNTPRGWPLTYEVSRWPMFVPGSCDGIGLCKWLDAREGRDCERLRTWPDGSTAAKGGRSGDS
jgi:hypothetical protein